MTFLMMLYVILLSTAFCTGDLLPVTNHVEYSLDILELYLGKGVLLFCGRCLEGSQQRCRILLYLCHFRLVLHEENEENEVKKRFIDSFKGLWSTLTTQVKLFIKLIPCV